VQTNEFADRRLARVTIDIRVPPTFPDKYLDALRRVADQCAVKKALQSPPEMVTTSTVVYNEPVSAVR
jgi:ribosomal protein S12 methylthiotransferase accessory factor